MMHLSAGLGWLGVSQAAAGALVSAVWQGFLLAVVAWAGLELLPKTPAAVRFAIWFAVFLVVTALPVVALWPHAVVAAKAGGRGAWLTLNARWCVGIVAVWVLASLVRAGTLVAAAVRLRGLWKRAEVVEVIRPQTVKLCEMGDPSFGNKDAFKHGRRARVCVSDEVDRPSVIGFFSPKILIPRWLIEKLTAEELRQIVLHETGHLGRADDWMNLVQKIALVVFPLNPALVWVERRLCFERELACDERVLAETGAPKAYAACLAGLAEHRLDRRRGALSGGLSIGAVGRESELGRRVRRILERDPSMRPTHARLVLGGAMLGLMFGAVELGRCPSVVAFTGARAQGSGSSLQSGVVPGRSGSGFGVQAVVFHPETVQGLGNNSVPQRLKPKSKRAVYGTAKAVPLSKTTDMQIRKTGAGWMRALNYQLLRAREEQAMHDGQWVVVTSWNGADGSRVVMTSIRDSGNAQSMPSQDEVRQRLQDDQYAAVPVRGGWLLFQL